MLAINQSNNNFILQLGDCAENTKHNATNYSYGQFIFINSLAKYIEDKINKPVIKIGRIAGQLAKPRSKLYEDENEKILNYFGDLINNPLYNKTKRQANPLNLLKGYYYSKEVAKNINTFTKNTKKTFKNTNLLKENVYSNMFTSHEMLLLHYEEALTRVIHNKNYNLSSHKLWIGERTKQSTNAHVYFASTIENAIGIKVGLQTDLQDLLQTIYKINPNNKKGKIIIVTRLGYNNINFLFKLVNCLDEKKLNYSLISDPMHGNNIIINGKKTRIISDIVNEALLIKQNLEKLGKKLNGIHLEASYFAQNECLPCKKTQNIKPTLCDPRLSAEQSFNLINKLL